MAIRGYTIGPPPPARLTGFVEPVQTPWCLGIHPTDPRRIYVGDRSGYLICYDIAAAAAWNKASRLEEAVPADCECICLKVIKAHEGTIYSITVHPDGDCLITTGKDGDVKAWSLPDMEFIETLYKFDPCTCMAAFSPDGESIAILKSVEAVNCRAVLHLRFKSTAWHLLTIPSPAVRMAFTPDSGYIAVAGYTGKDKGQLLFIRRHDLLRIDADSDSFYAPVSLYFSPQFLEFSPSGRYLAYGASKSVALRDKRDPTQTRYLRDKDVEGLCAIAWHPGSEMLAVSYMTEEGGKVVLWDIISNKEAHSFNLPASPMTLLFAPDGKTLLAGGRNGVLHAWRTG